MAQKLDKLTIRGFKSIKSLEDFVLGDLNVLIGANGSGKSNFVEFFRFLHELVHERLQKYANVNGPADGFFYNGVSHTKSIEASLRFGANGYDFTLIPSATGGIVLDEESTFFSENSVEIRSVIGAGVLEGNLKKSKDLPGENRPIGSSWYIWDSISDWSVYHFHDTSLTSEIRRDSGIEQTHRLRPGGGNIAAFLLHLQREHRDIYLAIRSTIQRIAPYFDDFVLKVTRTGREDQVRLLWRQKGTDYVFSPGHLSDGTIRFICLTTALLQPDPPSTIVIDEPELGLHPEALAVLAGLLQSAATRTQIIVATQSPALLNEFEPEQIITVDQVNGATRLQRLNVEDLAVWLDEYTLGDLWLKGSISGGVNYG